jgi:hypothetical protein
MTQPGPDPAADPNLFFGQPIIVVAVLTIVLSTFAVGLRVWSRAVILRVFALEDWLVLLGWVRVAKSPLKTGNFHAEVDGINNALIALCSVLFGR